MNFPTNPTINSTYTIANKTWIWNGFTWTLKPPTITDINNNLNITGNITAASFIKTGGTGTQFLMADGTVDIYGTTAGTVSEGNHTHLKSDITNFAHTHNLSEIGITGLTANYLTKFNGSTLVNSSIFDNGNVIIGGNGFANGHAPAKLNVQGDLWVGDYNVPAKVNIEGTLNFRVLDRIVCGFKENHYDSTRGGITLQYTANNVLIDGLILDGLGNVGIGTAGFPTEKLDVNGTGKFKDDILMTFNTWSHDTDKNSLNKFLKLFDIDTSGNLVVKTNLYGTGEVTAYSSGTGVSGLTLMADMDANGKNITDVGLISSKFGLALKAGDTTWLTLSDDGIHNLFGEVEGLTSLSSVDLNASGKVTASEFKFGSWSFKQDISGRLGIYNGATEVACFNTDGTYVNL